MTGHFPAALRRRVMPDRPLRAECLEVVTTKRGLSDQGRGGWERCYINTTSTRECTVRPGFASEVVRMLMYVGLKNEPEQRVAA